MPTSPDRISAEALPDLQVLLDTMIEIAEDRLLKTGAFQPFGAHLAHEATVALVVPEPPHNTLPARVIAGMLEQQLRQKATATQLRAAAICEHVEIRSAEGCAPAVKVSAEHAFGESVSFFLPYSSTPSRDLVFGRMTARPRPRSMFTVED
jgi:hypothetical protein